MSFPSSAASKSNKFSELRNLPILEKHEDTNVGHQSEVRGALDGFMHQQTKNEVDKDAEMKVQRNHYAQLVLKLNLQAPSYHSVSLFVEAMMREVSVKEDVPTRAATATWALGLLSAQPSGHALREISDALLPAIYCQFDADRLSFASPSIQAQLRDPTAVRYNPYFTHTMYVEQVDVDKGNVSQLSETLERLLHANDERRNYVMRTIEEKLLTAKRNAFKTWRTFVRRRRILAFANERREERHQKELNQAYLKAVFYQWKVQVEASRSGFLTERLHDAAVQLENAKNQFQLQCYRADRLIQTTKEAKEELQQAVSLNEGLEKRVKELKDELVQREKEYNEKLSQSVGNAFSVVQSYRDTLSSMLQRQWPSEAYLTEPIETVEPDEGEGMNLLLGDVGDAGPSPTDMLLQWCNSIIRKMPSVDPYVPLRNFGSDFASGEFFYEIMRFVFPDATISLPPNCDREFRLNRLHEMCEQCQLCYVLEPSDFLSLREDKIALALSELYRRYVARRWKEMALTSVQKAEEEKKTLASAQESMSTGRVAGNIVDEVSFKRFLKDCEKYLEVAQRESSDHAYYERLLTEHNESIALNEAFLCSQRLRGLPIPHVGTWASRYFWRINSKALSDLKDVVASNVDATLWTQLLEGPLKLSLRSHVNTSSRLFYCYAGEGAKAMSETTFWRFVETSGIVNATLTKEVVSSIFDRVASPQLAAAIKSTPNKTSAEVQMLLCAARQEMNMRTVTSTQFVEILVRLAVQYYGKTLGLVEGVDRFFRELKIPVASMFCPAVVPFFEAECQEVFRFFSDDLTRIFFFYVKRQENSKLSKERALATQDGGRFGAVLSLSTFVSILRDCEYIADSNMSVRVFKNDGPLRLFITAIQIEELVESLCEFYEGSRPTELTFTLFTDALFALTYYWCADPLVPLSRKFAAFLTDMISQLIKTNTNTTLILGDPPAVSLEGGKKIVFF